jgi:hypothetical protein
MIAISGNYMLRRPKRSNNEFVAPKEKEISKKKCIPLRLTKNRPSAQGVQFLFLDFNVINHIFLT